MSVSSASVIVAVDDTVALNDSVTSTIPISSSLAAAAAAVSGPPTTTIDGTNRHQERKEGEGDENGTSTTSSMTNNSTNAAAPPAAATAEATNSASVEGATNTNTTETTDQMASDAEAPAVVELIHAGFTCDGCGQKPIVGLRYHCLTDVCDYDLCQRCQMKPPHPTTKSHTSEHVLSEGLEGKPREPDDPRTPWMIMMDNTMELLKWLLPLSDDESVTELMLILEKFQAGRTRLAELDAEGSEWGTVSSIDWTEKINLVISTHFLGGYGHCIRSLPQVQQNPDALESIMKYFELTRTYLETLPNMIRPATARLQEQQKLVDADRATVAAAKAAGITLTEDEYDTVKAERNTGVYCAMQYELYGYFRAYYLLIQVIHRGDYELGFAILKDTLNFWLKYCLFIMRAKDRYCLLTRQLCCHIFSLLLHPDNSLAVQYFFSGSEETNALIIASLSTMLVLGAHDSVIGEPERPGLCDAICQGSKAGGPLQTEPNTSNYRVGLGLMRNLMLIKRPHPDPLKAFNAYSPIIKVIDAFCLNFLELANVSGVVEPQDSIPIGFQLNGPDPSDAHTILGRLELLGIVAMQNAILGGFDSRFYADDPTRLIPVLTQLLQLVEQPKMELKIRCQVAFALAEAMATLPNEITPLFYEQYHALYPANTPIPVEKRLPVFHRLLNVVEQSLVISDSIEKSYPPFEQFRARMMWAISHCARLMPMKELRRNAPKSPLSVSSADEEQKENSVTGVADKSSPLTGPFDSNGELRNIFTWLMDLLELYLTNHPCTRSDGVPNPMSSTAGTGDLWGDRWQLHPRDYEFVAGMIDAIRRLDDAAPQDRLNTEIVRTHCAPFLPRLFPLLLTLQELLPPHKTSIIPIKVAGLSLIDDTIRFIPRSLLMDKNNWSRLQLISDRILSVPLVMPSKLEEERTLDLKDMIDLGRQQIYERCQQTGRWITYDLETEVAGLKNQPKARLPQLILLRSVYAESVHDMRSIMITAHGRILDELWSDYDAPLKAKLLPHLLRVLPSSYGTLPKTEEDELQAKEQREEKAKEKAKKTAAREAAKAQAMEAKERARAERAAAAAAANDENAPEDGDEPPLDEEEANTSEEEEDENGDGDGEEKEDDEALSNIHSSPGVDEERSAVMYVLGDMFAQAPFAPATDKALDAFYDTIWSQIMANHSAYGKVTTRPLALMTKYLPLVKPMALDKKWRPGEISVLAPTLQHQVTENVNLGIEVFKTSVEVGVIDSIFAGWGELLKGYGLAALGDGNDISSETINRRETELITYAMFIIQFAHPCQHDLDVTQPQAYDVDEWSQHMAVVDEPDDENKRAASIAEWRSKIELRYHAKFHAHGAACTDWACYYDETLKLAHRCCEFLGHLARARGSSFETRHKRIWKHLSFSAEKITWRGALGCYWTGVTESLGSEGFDTYKADVFEYMINNLTIKESQGLLLGASAYCLGNIFMHIDLPRIQTYLTRTLDALLQAYGYAQNKLDAHYKAMNDGTRVGLCQGIELPSWRNCQDGITVALGKILMVASSLPDVTSRLDELLRVFLSGLPLKNSMDDQKVVYSAVIKSINTFPQQHPGKIEPHYPRILFIFATVLDLNLGKHCILPQLEKFILMGAKSILKQQPLLRQTILVDEWKEKEAGHFGQRFIERIDGKPISSQSL